MPTYTIDYGGAQDGWANAASALANALTPDIEGEANARLMASQAHQNYAGAYANEQLARQRGAAAALSERELGVWNQLDAVMADEGMTPEERQEVFVTEFLPRLGKVDGSNVGDWNLAIGGMRGVDDATLSDLFVGAGGDYANSPEGFTADQRRQSQQFIMGEAGDTARANTALEFGRDFENMEVIRDGQPVIIYRKDLLPTDRAILSETEMRGSAPGAMPEGNPLFYEGTGLEQQDMNLILRTSQAAREGREISPEQKLAYNMAYARLMAPKTEIRTGSDGNTYQVITNPTAPAGLLPPFDMNASTVLPGTPAPVTPMGPGIPAPAAPAAGAGAGVSLPGTDTRPQTPVAPAAPPAVPAAPGLSVTQIPGMPPAPPGAPTEAQARYGQYAERIQGGMIPLMNMMGYDPMSGNLAPGGWRPTFAGRLLQDFAPDIARPYLQSDQDQTFYTRVAQTLNPLIRADSGAAVPDAEYPRYYAQYIPAAGEPDDVVKAKLDHLIVTQMAFAEVALTPSGRAAMQQAELTGNYEGVQAMLHAAKNRIADERGVQIAEFTYPPNGQPPQFVGIRPPGGGVTDLGTTGTAQPTGLPSTLTLPGGLEVEVLDWGN